MSRRMFPESEKIKETAQQSTFFNAIVDVSLSWYHFLFTKVYELILRIHLFVVSIKFLGLGDKIQAASDMVYALMPLWLTSLGHRLFELARPENVRRFWKKKTV